MVAKSGMKANEKGEPFGPPDRKFETYQSPKRPYFAISKWAMTRIPMIRPTRPGIHFSGLRREAAGVVGDFVITGINRILLSI